MVMPDLALCVKNYTFAYENSGKNILRNINLKVKIGECCCIIGSTGSGKTTLLLAIAGLIHRGKSSGSIITPQIKINNKNFQKHQTGHRIGIVLQNPETQLLTQTVGEEIAFGLENLCVAPEKMTEKILQALHAVGLNKPLNCPVNHLSMGQKYRLIVAAQLVMGSRLLLLDEPCGQLDEDGIKSLEQIISTLKQRGISFLICEHNAEKLKKVIGHVFLINKKNQLIETNFEQTASYTTCPKISYPDKNQEIIIQCNNLSIELEHGKKILSDFNLNIKKGEILSIYGANGTGKTSLLRSLCGFIKPVSGSIAVFGKTPSPKSLRGKIGILFQNPQKQLFETSVFNELAFIVRRLKIHEDIHSRIFTILKEFNLTEFCDHPTFKLSFGQKHLVAVACIIVSRPEIILLDDPFAGIDSDMAESIIKVLIDLNKSYDSTIIWTSHDIGNYGYFANKTLFLETF